jgi:hypothetical protein
MNNVHKEVIMATTCDYKCKKCGFSMHPGCGGYLYIENNKGERIAFLETEQGHCIDDLLSENLSIEAMKEKLGYNSYCVCLDCLEQFELDLGNEEENPDSDRYYYGAIKRRDERKCPRCKSQNVKTSMELVGKKCPSCHKGTFHEIWTDRVA